MHSAVLSEAQKKWCPDRVLDGSYFQVNWLLGLLNVYTLTYVKWDRHIQNWNDHIPLLQQKGLLENDKLIAKSLQLQKVEEIYKILEKIN